MEQIAVSSYSDITKVIGEYPNSPDNPYYFRGLKEGYATTPSIAYPDSACKLTNEQFYTNYEHAVITAFNNHLRDGFGIADYTVNDWELWFLARHFGLKSRLTDFTKDISVALQFAMEMSGNSPCTLYCLDIRGITHRRQEELTDPLVHNELCLIQPTLQYRTTMVKMGVSRMFIQLGKFLHQPLTTVATPLTEQINEQFWKVLIIQPEHFHKIREEVGIVFSVDMTKPLVVSHILDGICKHINSSHLPN